MRAGVAADEQGLLVGVDVGAASPAAICEQVDLLVVPQPTRADRDTRRLAFGGGLEVEGQHA